ADRAHTGGLSFDDIAVLYRAGNQARPIMSALAKECLPFQQRSHNRLGDHPGVRMLLGYLPELDPSVGTPALLKLAAQRAIDELDTDVLADEQDERLTLIRDAVDLLGPLARRQEPDAFRAELTLGVQMG